MSIIPQVNQPSGSLKINLFSFGFKHGQPDADMVWDVRFLPNPYWDEGLKSFTGLDERISRYVLDNEKGGKFLELLDPLVLFLAQSFSDSNREEVRLAIGCTGGKHRSVAVTVHLARLLSVNGLQIEVSHRDITKD
ncbi:MAG: hypothetical protein OEM02_02545 [Desulfobulbaceae bacterium]|nr:hypothetical protein [Desulfobulbaceae bacterium]